MISLALFPGPRMGEGPEGGTRPPKQDPCLLCLHLWLDIHLWSLAVALEPQLRWLCPRGAVYEMMLSWWLGLENG